MASLATPSPDYRSPAQRFSEDLMHLICTTYKTHGEGRRSTNVLRPNAYNIVTVVGGVQFTIEVQEGRTR